MHKMSVIIQKQFPFISEAFKYGSRHFQCYCGLNNVTFVGEQLKRFAQKTVCAVERSH